MGARPGLPFRIAWKITPQQSAGAGAEPMLYAATSQDAVQGGYYGPRWGLIGPARRQRPPARALDTNVSNRLWGEAERLTGVKVLAQL
jgi:hypothetical protein